MPTIAAVLPERTMAVTERFEVGFSWTRSTAALLECRSHALRDADGGIWLIDPFDGDQLDEELQALGGEVRGVFVLLDRHVRDAPAIARRHEVPLYVPPGKWRRGHPRPDGATTFKQLRDSDSPFQLDPIVQRPGQWLEWSLWWPAELILVVADAVGTAGHYRSRAQEAVAVHPLLRIVAPPSPLRDLGVRPRKLLLGHGCPVDHEVAYSIDIALDEARRELPSMLLAMPRNVVRFVRGSLGVARARC